MGPFGVTCENNIPKGGPSKPPGSLISWRLFCLHGEEGSSMRSKMARCLFLILVLAGSIIFSFPRQSKSDNGELNVMTVNLLFSEIRNRDARLDIIADFVISSEEPIDLILLQEVVGGTLSRTANSALDLRNKLAARGFNYHLSYRMANGLPGLLTVGNAILSLHDILFTVSATLPFESEEIFQGVEIPLKRKVMMSRIDVPGFGDMNVYNTHLCAYCDPGERLEQTKALINFVKTVEWFIPGSNRIILGGDFNIPDALIGSRFAPEYDLIVSNGFTDSYAAFHGCDHNQCCDADFSAISGCTYAVAGNPYAFNLFTHEPEEPVRIDYIFLKNVSKILSSEVIFNSDPSWVSDHSPVLTKIALP
jgi:maltose 6'-phosphate phosphatase